MPKETDMTLVSMPVLGLHELARQCWPGDTNDDGAHDAHVAYLLALNSDTLQNDTSHQVGVPVRVPSSVAPRVVVPEDAPPDVPPDTPDDTPTDKRNKLDSNSNNNSRHGG